MKSSISVSIILLIFSFLYQAPSSHGIAAGERISSTTSYRSFLAEEQRRGRTGTRQIPDCGQMVSRSHYSENPQCRWCRSDELDDMCFSNAEAWRLPQQVFTCDS